MADRVLGEAEALPISRQLRRRQKFRQHQKDRNSQEPGRNKCSERDDDHVAHALFHQRQQRLHAKQAQKHQAGKAAGAVEQQRLDGTPERHAGSPQQPQADGIAADKADRDLLEEEAAERNLRRRRQRAPRVDAGQHELQPNPGQQTHFEEENAERAENPDAVQYAPVGQHAGVVEARGEDRDQADRHERLDRHQRKTLHVRSGHVLCVETGRLRLGRE